MVLLPCCQVFRSRASPAGWMAWPCMLDQTRRVTCGWSWYAELVTTQSWYTGPAGEQSGAWFQWDAEWKLCRVSRPDPGVWDWSSPCHSSVLWSQKIEHHCQDKCSIELTLTSSFHLSASSSCVTRTSAVPLSHCHIPSLLLQMHVHHPDHVDDSISEVVEYLVLIYCLSSILKLSW